MAALKLFHSISLQGKTTIYHFFNALAKIMDNMGSKMFKVRGSCTAQTCKGELAVECIACPKAGVNLPEGWEKAPVEMRYAFYLI
jgi:hypothetical protein